MEIGRFSSPEALLEDLKTKLELQRIHIKNSFVSRAIANLKIPIVTLKKALDILFLAMRPSYLETILVWGLLYLTIKVRDRVYDVTRRLLADYLLMKTVITWR